MKRILITGFGGFVSNHLIEFIEKLDTSFEIFGVSRSFIRHPKIINSVFNHVIMDLKQESSVYELIKSIEPDYVIHLASNSSVAYSWSEPVKSFQNNTNIFLNLVEAIRVCNLKSRVLSVGSSEEYGLVDLNDLPLKEDSKLNPISPYAVARVSQELISTIYTKGYGIDILKTRSFNHIGPGQSSSFVISSFAKQIIERKLNLANGPIQVGNIDLVRDFIDVRDVVSAYWNILLNGKTGENYNVCSGVGFSIKEVLEKMIQIAGKKCTIEIQKDLIRPIDNPIIIGDNNKILFDCDWKPAYKIEDSLKDILNYWSQKLSNNG